MNTETLLAFTGHAQAAMAWAILAIPQTNVGQQVKRVEVARALSAMALRAYRTAQMDDPEARSQIEAACRDAEAEHAVQVHMDCMARILGAVKLTEDGKAQAELSGLLTAVEYGFWGAEKGQNLQETLHAAQLLYEG